MRFTSIQYEIFIIYTYLYKNTDLSDVFFVTQVVNKSNDCIIIIMFYFYHS